MTWYVRTETREFGPLSGQALRAIAATGQIDGRTLVRRSVREEWVSVATVPGILPPAGRVMSPPVARVAAPPAPKPASEPTLALVPDPPSTSAPEPTLALVPDPPSTSAPEPTFVLVPEPRRALSPTSPSTPAPALTLEGLPIPEPEPDLATPWRRFWARWVDVIFGACIVGFVLGSAWRRTPATRGTRRSSSGTRPTW
jgi:GYF domain 2/Cornifin (SPRR) family